MNSALSTRKTLADLLLSIEVKLEALTWISIQRKGCRRLVLVHEPRLVFWAVACLESSGWSNEKISNFLKLHPVDRHWWALRQVLDEQALYVLDVKLDEFLALE